MTDNTNLLVSTEWLAAHLNAPDIRILDCSLKAVGEKCDTYAEFLWRHIPGARFFDIEDIADDRSDLPHMVPPIEQFISEVRDLGIGDGHRVIVYDSSGIYSAARVWWMFRLFGKMDVAVLDGGLKKWVAEGREVEDGHPVIRDRHFTAQRNAGLVVDGTQVAAAAKLGDPQIVDARSPERFRGEVEEIHEGVRAGRIPGSLNVYYGSLLNEDGTMIGLDELRAVFAKAGVDLNRPVINTCGSGVTAGIVALALTMLGHTDWSVYDGSWSEWGMYDEFRIETG